MKKTILTLLCSLFLLGTAYAAAPGERVATQFFCASEAAALNIAKAANEKNDDKANALVEDALAKQECILLPSAVGVTIDRMDRSFGEVAVYVVKVGEGEFYVIGPSPRQADADAQ